MLTCAGILFFFVLLSFKRWPLWATVVRTPVKPKKQKIEYDIFNDAPSLPNFNDLTQVARNRGIPQKVIKGCKKIELAQLLNIPLIMNPNY